jgi:DNA-binding protein H-NS
MPRKLTLKQIDAQIEKLQQQAARIKEAEKDGVVARIKEAISYYQITAADLGFGAGVRKGSKARGAKEKATSQAGRVKYKDGAGHAWSGFGRKPQWYVDALANGKTEEDLRA